MHGFVTGDGDAGAARHCASMAPRGLPTPVAMAVTGVAMIADRPAKGAGGPERSWQSRSVSVGTLDVGAGPRRLPSIFQRVDLPVGTRYCFALMDINLTVVERIILRNQYLILKQLHPKEAEHYEKLISIVERGYEYEYGQLAEPLSGDLMPEKDFAEVIDILDMYSALQRSRKELADMAAEIEKAAVLN